MIYNRHFPPPSQIKFDVGITEVPGWNTPTRIIVLTSQDGIRQWRCEGLTANVTPEALQLLADLLETSEARHPVFSDEPLQVPSVAEAVL